MAPTVLGMDLLNFILAVFSALAALFSFINYMRQIVPTQKFLEVENTLIETRSLWREFEQESRLSDAHLDRFFEILDSLEDDVESFLFIASPSCNLILILRAWISTWSLIKLGNDVDKLRVGLLTLNSQRSTIARSQERMGRPDAPFVDFTILEKRYITTAESFIASFEGRKPRQPLAADVEANAGSAPESDISELYVDYNALAIPTPIPSIPLSWNGRRRGTRAKEELPFRRAKRPLSTRSSISINASRDRLATSQPLIHESPIPLLRFPHMSSSPNYAETKLD